MRGRALATILGLGVLASACGSGGDGSAQGSNVSPSGGGMDMGEHGTGADGEFSFGQPADAADADRVVAVTASDDLAFDPAQIEVTKGETIEFDVSNPGTVGHEFVIGDDEFQAAHEDEMAGMGGDGGMLPPDEVYAISVAPDETRSIAWTFSMDGVVKYGCHVPGHYEAGMVGAVTVT
ncbi:plastocyanin/azurin family copper-binding protein [soil metagenome]